MNRPGHLLASFLVIGSGSTHGEDESGTGIRQREECGLRDGDNVENLWHVGNLEPENLTIGVAVGLDQELCCIDLCGTRSVMYHGTPTQSEETHHCRSCPRLGTS